MIFLIRALYQIAIFVLFIALLPKALFEMLCTGKYRSSFKKRLGKGMPPKSPKGKKVVWAHAVSVGETKALAALLRRLREKHPDLYIVVTTLTETAHAEVKRSIPFADWYGYLPFDFLFLIKRALKAVKPDCVILCETDFWFNFLSCAKNQGAKILLVNGKMSERSFKRYSLFPAYSKKLFSLFDGIALQNIFYQKYFEPFCKKLQVTGNLKFDMKVPFLSPEEKKSLSSLIDTQERFIITIGSTHPGEENALLDALKPVIDKFPELLIVLVPRHPERFDEVAKLLEKTPWQFKRYTEHKPIEKQDKIYLLDAMGKLCAFYELSDVALGGGSYIPGIGGHNVCEPSAYGIPSLFGPYMEGQRELKELVLQYQAGIQSSLDELAKHVNQLKEDDSYRKQMGERGLSLSQQMRGSAEKTALFCEAFLFSLEQ